MQKPDEIPPEIRWKKYARDLVEYATDERTDMVQAITAYLTAIKETKSDTWLLAQLGLHDRFFFIFKILSRADIANNWLYDRCREVEANPDGNLDFWAREHYKSTIITFAGSLQEHARASATYPELFGHRRDYTLTIGILSHTRPIAKAFLQQIKIECEINSFLPFYYPDVFWLDPKRESPKWSLDDGLIFKRVTNPKEASVEAWGLVDSQPTGKHFSLLIYDDVVTQESVTTPDQIIKTTESWELSRNISSQVEGGTRRTWYVGTRYSFADTYAVMLTRQVANPRIHPATDTGTIDGKPVFLSDRDWKQKVKESSAKTIACQQLLNPIAGSEQEFKIEWFRRWDVRPETLNVAILVDPANSKKKGTSNSAFAVIGMDAAFNKFLLDGACHKMSLTERWEMLKNLHRKWVRAVGVQVVRVGYERYGMQADIEHFETMMEIEKYWFSVEEVNWPKNTPDTKDDRIRRLVPDHQNWRWFYPWEPDPAKPEQQDTSRMRNADERGQPYLIAKPIKQKDHEGKIYNVVTYLLRNEYLFFPATTAKDFMDAMSRFYDLDMRPPQIVNIKDTMPPASDFGA